MHALPRHIGRYEILARVGQGGMGVLYRAHDPALDRDVAIKMMLVDLESEEGARERFEREAKAVAKLQHRNVVTIHEFGECEGSPYIAMEFLGGHDLEELARREPPLSLDEKLDIVIQLCAGLGFAHERGIVHRDIKPSNVRVIEDGTAKILDFGIAKIARTGTTSQGQRLGSPSYMAPELLSDAMVDGRADLFSTGVLLYELLTGHKPFAGDSPTAVVYRILNESPPPLHSLVPDLPSLLADIVTRALEKDPDRRYARASELAADLQIVRLMNTASPATLATYESPVAALTAAAEVTLPRGTGSRTPGDSPTTVLLARPATAPSPALDVDFRRGEEVSAVVAGRRQLPVHPRWGVLVVAVSALAVVGLALAGLWVSLRPTAPTPAPQTTSAEPRAPSAEKTVPGSQAAAPDVRPPSTVTIVSVPPGARVLLDGRDTGLATPAEVTIEDDLPQTLRLTRAGYQATEVQLTAADLSAGTRTISLVPEPPAAPGVVELAGEYSFEVLEGARVLSGPSSGHELTLPARPTTLRLRSAQYFLDRAITVTPQSGRRQQLAAPSLGTLAVFAAIETCTVKIDDQEVGFPPIPRQAIVAGPHRVALQCPDGSGSTKNVVVEAGQRTTVTFDTIKD